jgi:predicted enzyme related to lactoylglutathione lyase
MTVFSQLTVYSATRTVRAVLAPPEKQPWGGIVAHFRDPDGNVITLLGSTQ